MDAKAGNCQEKDRKKSFYVSILPNLLILSEEERINEEKEAKTDEQEEEEEKMRIKSKRGEEGNGGCRVRWKRN